MLDLSRPRLLQAVILSLLIHVVILLGVVTVLPAQIDVPPAAIEVVFGADAARAAARPDKKPSTPLPVSQPLVAEVPKARPMVADKPVILASPARSARVAPTEAAVSPPTAAGSSVEAPADQVASPSSVPLPARDGVSANDLRDYRLSLAIAARRFKRYPPLARERGWEGTVELVLAVNAHRPEPDIALVRSSGFAALDQQAQDMLVQAARTTMLPASLKGRTFRVLLPVQFSLEGNQ